MPAYATTALTLDDESVPRLRARLLAGPGAAAFEPMTAAYRDASATVAGVAADLAHLLRDYDCAHGGDAAGATRVHLDALLHGTRTDADRLARAAAALQEQAAHHGAARREVAAGEPAAAPGTAAVPGAADLLGAVLAAAGPSSRARQALAVYQENSNHTLTTALPVFGPRPAGPEWRV
ncbi:hypothetical protein EV383_1157 [Pseudonocardia sediminis]|uniref:Uncharacterized protein n=1 Tax=Pseudonocardia sediminis TaxID=1397368 RepID=A0A4Q7UW65_PSEST|nr:hypothetical protein [Pseudonocardia sediminis]RZT84319.1 hypothetical protein EV383_1157 [Pseudonocardia sediminis]